jgi:hypothetical protein
MGWGDIAGRARTRPRAPSAFGVCDDCGEWYNLDDLKKQMEYYGPALQWTGFLKCQHCLDIPQAQLKPVILPPDPIPRYNPRPENFTAANNPAIETEGGSPIETEQGGIIESET